MPACELERVGSKVQSPAEGVGFDSSIDCGISVVSLSDRLDINKAQCIVQ